MYQWAYRNAAILGILLLALAIRLPALAYGLPLHLFADEEVNVYSALQMIQLQTLLPVLHPEAFTLLYEPPVLSYIYVLFFVPVAGMLYILQGMPALSQFADTLLLDTSVFWLVGRAINIFISLGSIYLVYRIALNLFEQKTAALFSAFFLATSFVNVTLAATTRHWEVSTFFSLLSLFFVLKYANDGQKQLSLIALSGVILGLSFGAGYLVYYLPFIGLLILYHTWRQTGSLKISAYVRPVLYFGIPFSLIAVAMVVVAPQPFFQQIIHHVYAERHTVPEFLFFYARTLWSYETPLLLGALFGAVALWRARQRELLILFGAFFATVLPIMFVFLWDIDRYVQPLVPILSLMAGYGAVSLLNTISNKKILTIGLIGIVTLYTLLVFGRFGILALRDDTRVHAKQWVEANIPMESTLIVDSERIRFTTTQEAAKLLETISPSSVRSTDRIALRNPDLPQRYNAFHVYLESESTPEKKQRLIDAALAVPAERKFFITDSWSLTMPEEVSGLVPISFENGSFVSVPRGLYIGGEEHHGTRSHILKLLWNTRYFGPDVWVYELPQKN